MMEALSDYVSESMDDGDGGRVPDDVLLFLSQVRAEYHMAKSDRYVENPINAFHLVHRVYHSWNSILQSITCDHCIHTRATTNLETSLGDLHADPTLTLAVTETDCEGVATAIVRLWRTYNLDLKALISGAILDTQTSPLTTEDVLYICRVLDATKQYYSEVIWLRTLHERLKEQQFPDMAIEARVVNVLATAYFKYSMPWESVRVIDEHLISDSDNTDMKLDRDYFQVRVDNIEEEDRHLTLTPPHERLAFAHYESLCRGEGTRSYRVLSRLRCFFEPTAIPLIRKKEEVLNYDPRVTMYHDVISDSEQAVLRNQVIQKLSRSHVVLDSGLTASTIRVSQTAWLEGSLDPVIEKLTKRVQLYTGLSTLELPEASHAEPFQVLNYGVGGMYEAHHDYLGDALMLDDQSLRGSGERIATWLFYINDVKAGGSTVFMDLNITVPVVKGAAAFWYNMKRSGEPDPRTKHAGCPVLLGSKWVSNKWIRSSAQCFRRTCGLSPGSLDGPLPL